MNTLRTETIKINSLSLDPTNARRHDAKNLAAIEGSLKLFGQRKPIVVTGANIVVAGNGTLEAAKSLGWKEIAIVRTPIDWTPEQVKAYALADNRTAELAEWDAKVLADQLIELDAVGWDVAEFGFEPIEPPSNSEDDEPLSFDENKPTRSKLGDLWQVGDHKIMCGDATDEITLNRIIKDSNIYAVITDPPYGISIVQNNKIGASNLAKTGNYKPVIGDESGDVAKKAFELVQKLIPKTKQAWWGANHYSQTAQLPNSSCWLVWNKNNGKNNFADCELAWTNIKSAVRMFTHTWNGMIRESERGKRVHPTQKPVALTKWIIELLDIPKKEIVLDLFAGSGSTIIGAAQNDFIGYGVELDPFYVDVIIDRLEKETGLEAELLES
jgi:DNA modification methylase